MKNFKPLLSALAVTISASALVSSSAFAHVVVSPNEAAPEDFVTFNISVPNEVSSPMTKLKISMPDDVDFVSPTVKAGWDAKIERSGKGADSHVTALVWTGGQIPGEQRDDFSFSAKTPKSGNLDWKAYQTFKNGKVISWDQTPSKTHDSSVTNPFSVTEISDEVASSHHGGKTESHETAMTENHKMNPLPMLISALALLIALIALAITLANRKHTVSKK